MEKRLSTPLPHEQFVHKFVRPMPGRTLIVGSRLYSEKPDRRKVYPDAIGIDMLPGDGVDLVLDLEEPLPAKLGTFEHVECWSVLEHSKRPWKMAANITRLMAHGGTLHISAPFVWRVHNFPSDYFRYTKEGIRALFPGISWHALAYAHEELKMNDMVPVLAKGDGHPHLPRTEVLGFGHRP